jgi:hypothetical protein
MQKVHDQFKNMQKMLKINAIEEQETEELPQDFVYSTPQEFLETVTQKINVDEAIYRCEAAYLFPTTSIEGEYVVVVLEIMNEELREFYNGRYLLQQWIKKQKKFQSTHHCKPNNFYLN